MPKIRIEGKHILTGTIPISGAKNSAVALIPAAILCKNKSKIYNVPQINDIDYLIKILELLNCKVEVKDNELIIDSSKVKYNEIPEDLSKMMRASYYFMGAMLARFKKVEISFPGGCKIGHRPIDIHLKGFKQLGATIKQIKNRYIIQAKELVGTRLYLDFASVGATINLMLAATGAKGKTRIENAAMEPEIVNIASFLINMGVKISGAGTKTIEIEGNTDLYDGVAEVFPDRIEASTYIIAGALIGENLKIKGIIKEHINAVLEKLKEAGLKYKLGKDEITLSKIQKIKPVNIKTVVYPGFPTDVQQIFTVLLTQADGEAKVVETIYDSRFAYSEYLNKMGADTSFNKNVLKVKGKTPLHGEEVYATDLRGGASLVVAALIADGVTEINEISQILRGYENIISKLKTVGAKIDLIE